MSHVRITLELASLDITLDKFSLPFKTFLQSCFESRISSLLFMLVRFPITSSLRQIFSMSRLLRHL